MPMIKVPIPTWTQYPTLKKSARFKRLADEAAALARVEKIIKARRSELSMELYERLADALPDEIKTIEVVPREMGHDDIVKILGELIPDDVEIGKASLTKRAAGESSRFDKKRLMQEPIECNECGAENHVTVDVIERCTVKGERSAGVSIKFTDEGESDE